MSVLLCDVGGTHVRFALSENGRLSPHKLRVDAYRDLTDAIAAFLQHVSFHAEKISAFYLAFSNRNEWNTHPGQIRGIIPNAVIRQVNDFEANAHGVLGAEKTDFALLKNGDGAPPEGASAAVIGVGTGLGLAYLRGEGRKFVQRTHGAHMLPAYAPQHEDLYKFLSKDKAEILIHEDALSGKGLYKIYQFLSTRNHLDLEYPDAETLMLKGKDNPVFQEALNIFHELLGIFAHHAVAFGYAYKGIYLTGGVIDRLMLAGLFNTEKFVENFHQKNIPVVLRDVRATPVYWIKDEFVSLKGLLHLAREDGCDA